MSKQYLQAPGFSSPMNLVLGMGCISEEFVKDAYNFASKNRVLKWLYGLHPEKIEDLNKIDVPSLKGKFNEYRNAAMTKEAIGIVEGVGGAVTTFVTYVLAANEPQMFQTALDNLYQLTIANIPSELGRNIASIAMLYGIFFGPFIAAIDGTTRVVLNDGERAKIDEVALKRNDWQQYYSKLKKETDVSANESKQKLKQREITSF